MITMRTTIRTCQRALSRSTPVAGRNLVRASAVNVVEGGGAAGLVGGGFQRSVRGFAAESGPESHDDFKPKRKAPPPDLEGAIKMIDEQVKKHKIMLYMKGTPSRPQCGFSAQIVRVLHASGVDFDSVNVLDYPLIREGVKQYANWPTIPQLYLDGEFVGGTDIVTNLFQSGELAKMLEESTKNAGSKTSQ